MRYGDVTHFMEIFGDLFVRMASGRGRDDRYEKKIMGWLLLDV